VKKKTFLLKYQNFHLKVDNLFRVKKIQDGAKKTVGRWERETREYFNFFTF